MNIVCAWFATTILVIVGACDPAATTRLLVHPSAHAKPGASATDQIEAVGAMLEQRGFSRQTFERPSLSEESRTKIINDCGHLKYWMREGIQDTARYVTYAHVCSRHGSLHVSLSDSPRFSAAPATKALAAELETELPKNLGNVRVGTQE